MNKKIAISVILVAIGLNEEVNATGCDLFSSGGFLANVAECAVGEDSGAGQVIRQADIYNGQHNRPVDQMIYNGMNAIVPGSGTFAGGYAYMQNNRMLPQLPPAAFNNMPAPMYRQPVPMFIPQQPFIVR